MHFMAYVLRVMATLPVPVTYRVLCIIIRILSACVDQMVTHIQMSVVCELTPVVDVSTLLWHILVYVMEVIYQFIV